MIQGIGVDILDLKRIDQAMIERLSCRVLSASENCELDQIFQHKRRAEFFGGRFTAKEAFFKAVGTGIRPDWLSLIWVVKDPKGKPCFEIDNSLMDRLEIRGCVVHLSISHDCNQVVSMVVIEERTLL